MTARTGLVLLHGSELGAWVWQRLLPLLRAPALAVDLPDGSPGRRRDVRLASAVQELAAVVRAWPDADRVVLVGHSASGVLLPSLAAELGERVVAVVLLAAAPAQQGRSWLDLQPRHVRLLLRALFLARPDGVLSPAADTVRSLCADLDDDARALVLENRRAHPPGLLRDPVTTARSDVPVFAVLAREDRALPFAQAQAALARVSGAVVRRLDGGHLPMLGRPDELAQVLDEVVDVVAGGSRAAAPAGPPGQNKVGVPGSRPRSSS